MQTVEDFKSGRNPVEVLVYLYAERDGLHGSQRVPVKRVEVVVSHDGRLQHETSPAVQHEERLVHLHGLICKETIARLKDKTTEEQERTGAREIKLHIFQFTKPFENQILNTIILKLHKDPCQIYPICCPN